MSINVASIDGKDMDEPPPIWLLGLIKTIHILKCIRANFTFLSRSGKLIQMKTHFLSHFVGSSPSRGDIFF